MKVSRQISIYKECSTWILQFLFIKIPLKHIIGEQIFLTCHAFQGSPVAITTRDTTSFSQAVLQPPQRHHISDLESISHITAAYLSDKTLEDALEPSHISFLWLNWNKLPEPSAKLLFESQHLQTALLGSIYWSSLPNPLYTPLNYLCGTPK